MAAISFDPTLNHQVGKNNNGVVVEEIEGLIRVYKDGNVERPPIIPNVPCTSALVAGVTARDVVIDRFTSLWARIYVPSCTPERLPVLVYFHGGGFCVGSAAWSCYHDFLANNIAVKAGCVILSINYRLAPQHRLPAAYEDGNNAILWLKQLALSGSCEHKWWLNKCNFSSLFLAGDSAGANIAYHVTTGLGSNSTFGQTNMNPLHLKGTILIQPFFGGEERTGSEKNTKQPPNSALTLSASDTYWRLSLPIGANRDHPWSNPLVNGASKLRDLALPSAMLVFISELDILKDRNLEFCNALSSVGQRVEVVMQKGVGHAFQILHNFPNSQARIQDMVSHLKSFINKNQ